MESGGTPDVHATYLGTRTFGSLDGLRAVAILGVIWHHIAATPGAPLLARRGFLGVDLFFVISGFLISTLLLREQRRTGAISLRGFYFRRFLRIFPPYYLMLGVVAVTAWLKPGQTTPALWHDLPWAAAYLSNVVPMGSLLAITWSLSTEEQFYLVVPALQRFAPRGYRLLVPVAWVLVALPSFGVVPSLPRAHWLGAFGPILLGVMLAGLLDEPRAFRAAARVLGWPLAAPAAGAVALLACAATPEDILGWPRLLIHLSFATLLAACVVQERHGLRRLLSFAPLARIGAVSYGMYLWHHLAGHFVLPASARLGIAAPAALFFPFAAGAWVAAELSYRLVEVRFLALKTRGPWASPRPERTPRPAPADAPQAAGDPPSA